MQQQASSVLTQAELVALPADIIAATGYMLSRVAPAWPPRVPVGAMFLPTEKFRSPFQFLEVRRTFSVSITQAAYNKMMYYVAKAPVEVSGLGRVTRVGNAFCVEEVTILPQTNQRYETVISPEARYEFAMRLKREGKPREGWDLHWHSHVDFDARFSQQDMLMINENESSRFSLSIVVNKFFEHSCRVDFYEPLRYGISSLPLRVIPGELSRSAQNNLDREMAAMITNEVSGDD